jgi:hypothetical protein
MSRVGEIGGFGIVALGQTLVGCGIGLAGAPATDSVMEAVPPAKAGVGSAVNDTTREVGSALGVAILGSLLGSAYSAKMLDSVGGLPTAAAAAARDSLPGALEVARALPQGAARALGTAASSAFADAMGVSLVAGAAVAMMGAVLALVFIPGKRTSRSEDLRANQESAATIEPVRAMEAHDSRTSA